MNEQKNTRAQEHKFKKAQAFLTCALMACALMGLIGGCEEFADEESFYTFKAKPQQLREVDTLKLMEKTDVNETVETNKSAENQMKLSIEQCRAMTLSNNLDLKVQLVEPAIAATRVNAEEAKFESAFFSNLQYNKLNQPIASVLAVSGSNIESGTVDLGVQMPLRTGGTVTLDLTDNRTKTNFLGATFNPSYSATGSLSISQPLLRGAGKRANTHSIRILEYQRQITETLTKLEVIRVLANADRGYWRLYAARKELEVRLKEYELAQAQLEQTRRMVQLGEKAAVEEIRSEAGVAERLDAIIQAQKELRDRERELKQIMNDANLSVESPTALIPATEPDPVRYEIDRNRLTASAVENRMEMLELELQLAQDTSTIQFYENQALPLVSVDYTYRVNGLGAIRNDAYDMLSKRDFEDHIAGLQLIVPLGNEAAKNRLLEAQYRRSQRLVGKENRRTLIELEVLGAIEQLEANWQSILAGRQNSILAGRLYEAEKRQFAAGLRTSTDVLDQQAKFANAQSAEIRALTEYQIAQVDLAFATGTLIGADKVRWE